MSSHAYAGARIQCTPANSQQACSPRRGHTPWGPAGRAQAASQQVHRFHKGMHIHTTIQSTRMPPQHTPWGPAGKAQAVVLGYPCDAPAPGGPPPGWQQRRCRGWWRRQTPAGPDGRRQVFQTRASALWQPGGLRCANVWACSGGRCMICGSQQQVARLEGPCCDVQVLMHGACR